MMHGAATPFRRGRSIATFAFVLLGVGIILSGTGLAQTVVSDPWAKSDTTPPVVSALTLSPEAVDVSSGAKVVTVIATITDDLVGVAAGTQCPGYNSSPVQIRFRSPSGNQIQTGMAGTIGWGGLFISSDRATIL